MPYHTFKSLCTACPTNILLSSKSATCFCTSSNGFAVHAVVSNPPTITHMNRRLTMHHIRIPYPTPLRPVIHHPLPLTHENIQHLRPVKVHQTHASKRRLGTLQSHTDHLAIYRNVFPWSNPTDSVNSRPRRERGTLTIVDWHYTPPSHAPYRVTQTTIPHF